MIFYGHVKDREENFSVGAKGESGATLLLALIFLVIVSLVVVGLVQLTGNNLRNTSKFVSAQSFNSAANSANQLAIQFVRFNFLGTSLDGATPTSCWTTASGSVSATALNNQTVDSWCMTRWYPGVSTSQRVVTISTCLNSVSATACAQKPLLQTIVSIVDGGSACSPVVNATSAPNTCGRTESIAQWQFGAVAPVVTSVTTGSFTCSSGTPVTITGTNLSLANRVDFLLPGSAGSSSPVQGSGAVANGALSFNSPSTSSTSIQACTPTKPSANSFYVIVSTPMGSNVYGPSSLWAAG